MNPTIEELTAAVERKARKRPGVLRLMTDGSRTLVYGKNDPFRSWPISANELEEVAMGSETNV